MCALNPKQQWGEEISAVSTYHLQRLGCPERHTWLGHPAASERPGQARHRTGSICATVTCLNPLSPIRLGTTEPGNRTKAKTSPSLGSREKQKQEGGQAAAPEGKGEMGSVSSSWAMNEKAHCYCLSP